MAAHSAAASGPREPSFEVYPAGTKFWLDGAYVGEFGEAGLGKPLPWESTALQRCACARRSPVAAQRHAASPPVRLGTPAGDPFVEDTELEGNRSVPSLKVMVKLVTALAAMAEAHGWRMDPARLRDAAACMDEGTVAGSGDTVRDQVIDLHSRLVNLKAGGCLMLPSVSQSPVGERDRVPATSGGLHARPAMKQSPTLGSGWSFVRRGGSEPAEAMRS